MKADQSIINNGCVRWIKSLERDQEIAEKDCMLHMYKIRGGDEVGVELVWSFVFAY